MRCSIRPGQQKRTLPHSTLPLPRASKSSATRRFGGAGMSLVAAVADLHTPLDHASRNLRVLVRRCVVAVWRSDHVPEAYQDLIRRLAEVCRFIARELEEQQLPTAARDQLRKIGEASAHLQLTGSMSAVVILAQTRSMVADLMQLTGMDYYEARELLPDMD